MAIQSFSFGTREKNKEDSSVVRASLSFKDQTSANAVKRKTRDLSHKIGTSLQPIFINRKVEQDLKPRKIKPPIINPQCVVYSFTRDLCDSYYVGFTTRHLHQRIVERRNSTIGDEDLKRFISVRGAYCRHCTRAGRRQIKLWTRICLTWTHLKMCSQDSAAEWKDCRYRIRRLNSLSQKIKVKGKLSKLYNIPMI